MGARQQNPSGLDAKYSIQDLMPLLAWLTWTALFFLRDSHADPSVQQDFLISLVMQVYYAYTASGTDSRNFFVKYPVLACLSALLVWRIFRGRQQKHRNTVPPPIEKENEPWAKPLIFPCRTSHTRFFPQKHSFSYSYLCVGIPVGWRGRCGSMLSAEVREGKRQGWFHVNAEDFLERGMEGLGLRGKLERYLVGQVCCLHIYICEGLRC